jgi:hypothetical protein
MLAQIEQQRLAVERAEKEAAGRRKRQRERDAWNDVQEVGRKLREKETPRQRQSEAEPQSEGFER